MLTKVLVGDILESLEKNVLFMSADNLSHTLFSEKGDFIMQKGGFMEELERSASFLIYENNGLMAEILVANVCLIENSFDYFMKCLGVKADSKIEGCFSEV
ncbi:MAG: hypothetical protein U9O20_01740 [Patescibacteria group bacterium]|nr:hypothetical protein [Patescibacteria group bacterium]